MTAAACSLLMERGESGTCLLGRSYGCAADATAIWVASGCRGVFACGDARVWCPSGVGAVMGNTTCSTVRAPELASHSWDQCPSQGDLDDPRALESLVMARRSKDHDLLLLLYGHASASAIQLPISGAEQGLRFLLAQLGALEALTGTGETYLVITPRLAIEGHPDDNVCLSVLRPRGICCGWSRAYSDFFTSWRLPPTHVFPLFALRFWLAARVLQLGTNILYVDMDVHLSKDPFALMRLGGLREFDILFHGDEGWPIHASSGRRIGFGELPFDCSGGRRPLLLEHEHGGHRPHPPRARSCSCGLVAAPRLNTGFMWARATAGVAALFGRVGELVLERLRGPAPSGLSASSGAQDYLTVMEQLVANEVVYAAARLPSSWAGDNSCHELDVECRSFVKGAKWVHPLGWQARYWAVARPRNSSVWLVSPVHPPLTAFVAGDGHVDLPQRLATTAPMPRRSPHHGGLQGCSAPGPPAELVAHTELELGLRLAVLPQSIVGKVCGKRRVNVSILKEPGTQPIPCERLRSTATLLGQHAHHLQMVNRYTTEWIFDALGWWAGGLPRHRSDMGRRSTAECTEQTALERQGVLIGSRSAQHSIVCAPPAPGEQPTCPCCWRARNELAMSRTTGCNRWDPQS